MNLKKDTMKRGWFMEKIKDSLETFFTIWGILLIVNQAVIFGGCFNPLCIFAALPHTGVIAFYLTLLISNEDNTLKYNEVDTQPQYDKTKVHAANPFINNKKETEKNTDYVANIGLIFTNKLIITQDKITWKNTTFLLNEITELSWGILEYTDTGWGTTKTTYYINFKDNNVIANIVVDKKRIYDEIISRLNLAVGQRITNDWIEFFNNDKVKSYNNAIIHNDGVIIRKKTFYPPVKKMFYWNEIVATARNGNFIIEAIEDKKFNVEISFRNFYNIYFLKNLILMVKENQNITKISDLKNINHNRDIQKLNYVLKSLELSLQNVIEKRAEYLNNIKEFKNTYNLNLGELIRSIFILKKEILYQQIIKLEQFGEPYKSNFKIFEEFKGTINEFERKEEYVEDYRIKMMYEEAKVNFDEYENEYKQSKENQKDVLQLSDDEKVEIKELFKKAIRRFHPDIVPDEFKEKTTKIIQQFNDAYSNKNLKKVKEIVSSLENDFVFEFASNIIEDKIELQEKINEYKQNIKEIEDEIARIVEDDTFQTISEIDDWNSYFEARNRDLEKGKEILVEEFKIIFEDKIKRHIKDNLRSDKFDGLLIDRYNIEILEIQNNTAYLKTKYTGLIPIYSYVNIEAAIKDKTHFQCILENPFCKVVLLDDYFGIRGFGINSNEYKELNTGNDIEYQKILQL